MSAVIAARPSCPAGSAPRPPSICITKVTIGNAGVLDGADFQTVGERVTDDRGKAKLRIGTGRGKPGAIDPRHHETDTGSEPGKRERGLAARNDAQQDAAIEGEVLRAAARRPIHGVALR